MPGMRAFNLQLFWADLAGGRPKQMLYGDFMGEPSAMTDPDRRTEQKPYEGLFLY